MYNKKYHFIQKGRYNMPKYEYAKLEQKTEYGNWHFFMNDVRITGEYEYAPLLDILNRLGKDRWKLVLKTDEDNFIIMREIQ